MQIETPANAAQSKHIALTYPDGSPIVNGAGQPVYAVDSPQYAGPAIVAQRDRAVRVKFTNYLPTGTAGNLFLPVDTTVMGAGAGPSGGDVHAEPRRTVHLHGGATPWISDGTPYQWTTPGAEVRRTSAASASSSCPTCGSTPRERGPSGTAGATNDPGPGSLHLSTTPTSRARG